VLLEEMNKKISVHKKSQAGVAQPVSSTLSL